MEIVWSTLHSDVIAYRNLKHVSGLKYKAELFVPHSETWEEDEYLIKDTFTSFQDAYMSIAQSILEDYTSTPVSLRKEVGTKEVAPGSLFYVKWIPVQIVKVLSAPSRFNTVQVSRWNPEAGEFNTDTYWQNVDELLQSPENYRDKIVAGLNRQRELYQKYEMI